MAVRDELREALVFEDLIEEYQQRSDAIEQEVKEEFDEAREELHKRKQAGIETERQHRNLLNLAVYPFTEQGTICRELGYRFFRGSPLYELDEPNFDFLIARLEPTNKPAILIAGEAKSSVGSPQGVLTEIQQATTALKNNDGYVLSEYLGQDEDRDYILEPVSVVHSGDSTAMMKAVVENGADIRVWHGPSAGKQELHLAKPPEGTENPINHSHHDPELRELMNEPTPSLRSTFNVWPKTHRLVQMQSLIYAASRGEGTSLYVSRHSLSRFLSQDLFYFDEGEREELADQVIQIGLDIGFLERDGGHEEYRIVSKGTRRELQERTLQEKWISWKIEQDQAEEIEERLAALEEELMAKRENRRTLEDY